MANKDYYDNYYANYYKSYYQTTTESVRQSYPSQSYPQASINQNLQYPSQRTPQSNQQSSPTNRLNSDVVPAETALDGDENTIYIDENGLFQIGKKKLVNAGQSVIDDDAIVFQSDESQYDQRTYFFNDKSSRINNANARAANSKTISFNGLPVFSN